MSCLRHQCYFSECFIKCKPIFINFIYFPQFTRKKYIKYYYRKNSMNLSLIYLARYFVNHNDYAGKTSRNWTIYLKERFHIISVLPPIQREFN